MDGQEKAGRCKWVALGFTIFLLQGLLPISFIGGFTGLNASQIFGRPPSHLLGRTFVFAGMILTVFVATTLAVLLLAAINKVAAVLFSRPRCSGLS
jgi:hypothetical protein